MMSLFMPGDKVKYYGNKFKTELGTKVGLVVSCVKNEPDAFVIDFGDDVYILSVNSLQRVSANADWKPTRRHHNDDE